MFDILELNTKKMTEMAEKFNELYKDTGLKPEAFIEAFSKMSAQAPAMPKVNFNKNGYEIRTQVLEMAQGNVWNDYHAKFAGWEQTIKRDQETGEVVNTVTLPEIPGADEVLETAQKFYDFINNNK